MTIKTLVSAGIAAFMASAALGQSLDPVRVETFRSILKGNDCTLTEAAAGNILPRFDFTRDETRAIVGALVAAGEVRLDGNTLNLVDGSCGTGDPVADLLARPDVQQFIAVMAENNCAMSETEGEAVFTARGMTKAQVGEIVAPLIRANMATFSGGVLRVDGAYCSASVPQEAPVPAGTAAGLDRSGMFGMTRVRQLVDAMAQNGCTLNMEEADGYLAEVGMEHSFATAIARKMLSDGYASMADARHMRLSAPYCIPAGGASGGGAPARPQVEAPAETPASSVAGQDGAPRDVFLSVAAQNGCELNIAQAESALGAAGLRMDQAYTVVDALIAEENASLSDSGALVSINPALCGAEMQPVEPVAPVPAPVQEAPPAAPADTASTDQPAIAPGDPRAAVLAMLAENGCEITQANAADMIASAGLDYTVSMQILTRMLGAGEAASPDGGQTLQVGAPLCVAAKAEPMTPREAFIDLIKQNDCSITAAEFGNLLPYNGLDASTAFGMISALEAEGVISLPATRDVVTLSSEMCR